MQIKAMAVPGARLRVRMGIQVRNDARLQVNGRKCILRLTAFTCNAKTIVFLCCLQALFFRKKHPKPNSPRRTQGVDVDIFPVKVPATATTLDDILDVCRQILIQRGAAKVVHTWIEVDNVQQHVLPGRRAVRLVVIQSVCVHVNILYVMLQVRNIIDSFNLPSLSLTLSHSLRFWWRRPGCPRWLRGELATTP